MQDSYKEPILLPPCFEGDIYKMPIEGPIIFKRGIYLCSSTEEYIYKEIKLQNFQLETGAIIKAAYDSESDEVIIVAHPHLNNRLGIGLATNYIRFIMQMPMECR